MKIWYGEVHGGGQLKGDLAQWRLCRPVSLKNHFRAIRADVHPRDGLVTGTACAWALSTMLVKVLHGVFDPAPESLAVPWSYLGAVTAIALVATMAASVAAIRHARTPNLELLRSL